MDVRDGTHDSPKYTPSGYPLVTSKNLVNGQIDFSTCSFISKEDFDAIAKRSAVDDGDILYAMIGTIGNPVIVQKQSEFAIKNVALFKFNNQNVSNRYVYYFLNSELAVNQFNSNSRGGTQKFVSLNNIRDLKIPLPPLAEQQKIAAILDAADSLRQKDQQLVERYTALSQSLFLEMFGDPVTNPKEFNNQKLGNICVVGSSSRVFVEDFVDYGVPFYRGTEVGKLGAGENINPHLFITQNHYDNLKEKTGVPKIGDLLLPSICDDGRIYRVEDNNPFYFKDGRVLWIKVNESSINSIYLKHYLKNLFKTDYSSFASGSTFAELKIVALKGIKILMPQIELQNQFAERIQLIEAQKQQAQRSLEQSEALFNSLLQRAFTGELTAKMAA